MWTTAFASSNPLIAPLALLGLCALLAVLLRPRGIDGKTFAPVSTRAVRPRSPTYIPLTLGNVTIDLQPRKDDTIHVAISGSSGLGKSTAVLPLFDLDLGVLCIALDNTRPISAKVREIGGVEWTNEPEWGVGLDLLGGHPRVTSEVLVEGWAAKTAGDTGKWRDIAAGRLWTALANCDSQGATRSISLLVAALLERSGNTEADRACQDWSARLASLARWLGPALGPDIDLVQAMRDRRKVLLRLNRFANPRLAPMLGGMLLVHARRVAEEAGVPFVLIVEEAGQLGLYEQQISALAQAGRDRGVPLVLLTQNASLLPLEVQNNVSVWVSFAQEARRELTFAAERLRLEPEQLQRETLNDQGRGWCYVRAPGVPTTLVHVKQQRPKRVSTNGLPLSEFTVSRERTPRYVVREIAAERAELRALPAPSEAVTTLLAGVYHEGGCERWRGKHDRAGHRKDCAKNCADRKHLDGCYGLVWWEGKWQRVHRVRWALANGPIPMGVDGKTLTVDHRRTCFKDCSTLTHLDLCTDVENTRRSWRVGRRKRSAAVAAD